MRDKVFEIISPDEVSFDAYTIVLGIFRSMEWHSLTPKDKNFFFDECLQRIIKSICFWNGYIETMQALYTQVYKRELDGTVKNCIREYKLWQVEGFRILEIFFEHGADPNGYRPATLLDYAFFS